MNRNLELLQADLAAALNGLDEVQTQLRPTKESSRWSIQEIVGHLRLTYAATADAMDARIVKASPTKARPSPIQYAAQLAIIRIGRFPRGRLAPERVVPAPGAMAVSGAAITAEVEAALSLMASRIDQAEAVFGSGCRAVSHIVLGPLSTSQWRKFHLVHGRHHIRQILAIRREHGV